MANPVQAVGSHIQELSGGRKTALALILAIIFAEMLLSGRVADVWKALWGPTKPLALTGGNNNKGGSTDTTPPPGTVIGST